MPLRNLFFALQTVDAGTKVDWLQPTPGRRPPTPDLSLGLRAQGGAVMAVLMKHAGLEREAAAKFIARQLPNAVFKTLAPVAVQQPWDVVIDWREQAKKHDNEIGQYMLKHIKMTANAECPGETGVRL